MEMIYNNFKGSVVFDSETNKFSGRVLNIKNSNLTYESDSMEGLIEEFQNVVDEYEALQEMLKM